MFVLHCVLPEFDYKSVGTGHTYLSPSITGEHDWAAKCYFIIRSLDQMLSQVVST